MLTHRICKAALAGLFLAAAVPSIAAEPTAAPAAAVPKAKKQARNAGANDGALICKNIRLSGSRIPQETCATAAEWKELEEEGYRAF